MMSPLDSTVITNGDYEFQIYIDNKPVDFIEFNSEINIVPVANKNYEIRIKNNSDEAVAATINNDGIEVFGAFNHIINAKSEETIRGFLQLGSVKRFLFVETPEDLHQNSQVVKDSPQKGLITCILCATQRVTNQTPKEPLSAKHIKNLVDVDTIENNANLTNFNKKKYNVGTKGGCSEDISLVVGNDYIIKESVAKFCVRFNAVKFLLHCDFNEKNIKEDIE